MTRDLLLIVTIAGERVVLRAAAIESVIEIEVLTRVPMAPPHIAGLTALRSRVLTAIDCRRALEQPPGAVPGPGTPAAVVAHEGHHYALLVDAVADVTAALSEPMPLRARLSPGWARASPGMVETAEGPLLLVDPGALIAGPGAIRVAA